MTDRDKQKLRILRFLSNGFADPVEASAVDTVLLDAGERGAIPLPKALLVSMIQEGILKVDKGRISVASSTDTRPDNHREIRAITLDGPESVTVAMNLAESPLGQLVRRKGRDGEPFLSQAEFLAGERLRADYTRGQIMPRLGANWEASVSSGRRDGGIADLTDTALAARIRVEKACEAVGPELSGLLIDVCCFLKGMEVVEMERRWPARSAKIVLKTALGALSRHYNPKVRTRPRHTVHWGAIDYRPSIR